MENIIFPSSLFRSRIRRDLLALFFTNPESRYYVRQLQSVLGVSVGSLHRELKHLERSGVLVSEPVANAKFYSVNTSYPLYAELRSIVAKTVGLRDRLRQAVRAAGAPVLAFIHGSFAAGNETRESDIDLFLVGRMNLRALDMNLRAIEHALDREIEYAAMTEREFLNELGGSSHFLATVLDEPKVFLIGDEAELQRLAKGRLHQADQAVDRADRGSARRRREGQPSGG